LYSPLDLGKGGTLQRCVPVNLDGKRGLLLVYAQEWES
jgi:hypothetical protein